MLTSIRWLYVLFSIIVINATNINAEVMPLVTTMQKNYASLKNFSATFTQELIHKESGSKETRSGTLLFEKPLFIRWETQKPHAELLIVDEHAIWDYLPDDQLAYKYSKELIQDSTSIIQVITGQTSLDENFSIEHESNSSEFIVLHLYPKEPTTQMVEAWLWLNPKNGLIHQAKVIDFYGNINIITFLKLTINTSLNKNVFKVKLPKNVTIENLVDQPVPERPLFN